MHPVLSITRHANRIYMFAGGAALVLMAVHVALDAIMKYVFSIPIPATLETVAYYYMPCAVALPLAFVEMKNQHVAVEMLHQMFPAGLQRVVLVFNGFVSLAFLGIITFLAGREAYRKFDIGEYMFGEYPIVIWPGRIVFFLGFLFFGVVVLMKTITLIQTTTDHFARLVDADPELQK